MPSTPHELSYVLKNYIYSMMIEKNLFKYIYKNSKREQLLISIIIWCSYPVYLITLELPKIIVNEALEISGPQHGFDFSLLGVNFHFAGNQLEFLLMLCFVFLASVLLSGYLKFTMNISVGRLGERMLRRLRYQLYSRVMRFPEKHLTNVNNGEVVNMVTAEVEPIAGFSGESLSTPQFYGGQLFLALGFILYQDIFLGAAALVFYPLQIWLIPKLQRKINMLAKERIKEVRKLSEQINMTMQHVKEMRSNAMTRYEMAHICHYLSRIYWIRFEIFHRKFFIKYLNSFIDKLTPFFFFSIGGWQIIEGHLEIGSLIAVLSAYKDIGGPWKEMIKWYQQKEDIRVKFEQVVSQFELETLLDANLLTHEPIIHDTAQDIVVKNMSLYDGNMAILHNISCRISPHKNYILTDDGDGEASNMAKLIARVNDCPPDSIFYNDISFSTLNYAQTGHLISYAHNMMYMVDSTIYDNITYNLNNTPYDESAEALKERQLEVMEATRTGNSSDDFTAAWFNNDSVTHDTILTIVDSLHFEDDLFNMGLTAPIPNIGNASSNMCEHIVQIRHQLGQYLRDNNMQDMINIFNPERYNILAPVIENIIFGASHDNANLLEFTHNNAFRTFLRNQDIDDCFIADGVNNVDDFFITLGMNAIRNTYDIFKDLPSHHELYKKVAFITADNLTDYHMIAQQSITELTTDERDIFFNITMQLTPGIHRFGIIDDDIQALILRLRTLLHSTSITGLTNNIVPYDYAIYQDNLSIIDNIVFGKIDTTKINVMERLLPIIKDIISHDNLYKKIVSLGLLADVGNRGSKLSKVLYNKIILSRILLKNNSFIVLDGVLDSMNKQQAIILLQAILTYRSGKSTIIVMHDNDSCDMVDNVLFFKNKKLVTP